MAGGVEEFAECRIAVEKGETIGSVNCKTLFVSTAYASNDRSSYSHLLFLASNNPPFLCRHHNHDNPSCFISLSHFCVLLLARPNIFHCTWEVW